MTERNRTIDKLRGICMLGVLGIHTGSLALMCASPNPHLYMLLEILSRYSVPAFFFISGYGLFCHYKPGTELNYREFIKKRFQRRALFKLVAVLYGIFYHRRTRLHTVVFTARSAAHPLLGAGLLPPVFYDNSFVVLCLLPAVPKTDGVHAAYRFKNRLCFAVYTANAV